MMVFSSDRDRKSHGHTVSDMLSEDSAKSLLDMVREPIIILNAELAVMFANQPSCRLLGANRANILGRHFCNLDLGLDHPDRVATVLKQIVAAVPRTEADDPVELPSKLHHMVVKARAFDRWPGVDRVVVVSCESTPAMSVPKSPIVLGSHPALLLQEVQHRIANSLQMVASTMLVRAHRTKCHEARLELEDMRRRVMSIAAIHEHLGAIEENGVVQLMPYLDRLADALSGSLVTGNQRLSLTVTPLRCVLPADEVISIGLILTELVTNAVKHAFGNPTDGMISISFEMAGPDWRLVVSDDGRGIIDRSRRSAGMGTRIVQAIARKLDAHVAYSRTIPRGTTVTVARGQFEESEGSTATR